MRQGEGIVPEFCLWLQQRYRHVSHLHPLSFLPVYCNNCKLHWIIEIIWWLACWPSSLHKKVACCARIATFRKNEIVPSKYLLNWSMIFYMLKISNFLTSIFKSGCKQDDALKFYFIFPFMIIRCSDPGILDVWQFYIYL